MAEKTVKVAGEEVEATEVEKALELLRKTREQRAKQRDKQKNDPEAKAKADARALRLRIKNTLLQQKAVAAGLTVSNEEIDAYIASKA